MFKKLLWLLLAASTTGFAQVCSFPPCYYDQSTLSPVTNVPCTNGTTGATDATLIAKALDAVASAGGGTVQLVGACKVNARKLIPSNVVLDGGWALFTLAAAGNWAGSTILSPFGCVDGAHDIIFTHFNADLAGAPANVKLLACQGDATVTTYTKLHFTDNHVLTPGDGVAFAAVSDSTVTGNYIACTAGACIDYWSLGGNAIITGNTVKTGAGAAIGIIYTAFKTDNVTATNKQYATIANNYVELDNPSGVGEGIYLQGYEGTCSFGTTNHAYSHVTGNTIVAAVGQQSLPIWADLCIYYTTIDHNIIIGDGSTVNVRSAIMVGGTTVGVMVEDNIAQGYFAPTAAINEQGVFNNRGNDGSLINNKSFNGSSVVTNTYLLKPSTIVYGNDGGTAGGTGIVDFVNPVTLSGGVSGNALVYDLYQWGVPTIVEGSGTANNNGAMTITAISSASACTSVTGCFMYYPVNAICSAASGTGPCVAGNPAGLYFTRCTTTTACTAFQETLPAGTLPVTVASPTAFSDTMAAVGYTQTTASLLPMVTLSIPAGTIKINGGSLTVKTFGQRPNNANTVIQQWQYGGITFGLASTVSVNWYPMERTILNEGQTNNQVIMGNATSGATDYVFNTANSSFMGVGTGTNQNLIIYCQINVATDFCEIWGGKVQVN